MENIAHIRVSRRMQSEILNARRKLVRKELNRGHWGWKLENYSKKILLIKM